MGLHFTIAYARKKRLETKALQMQQLFYASICHHTPE